MFRKTHIVAKPTGFYYYYYFIKLLIYLFLVNKEITKTKPLLKEIDPSYKYIILFLLL